MKTRKYVKSNAKNDLERIIEAQALLEEALRKQPLCKHTVTVELSDGNLFQIWASPRLEKVYTA